MSSLILEKVVALANYIAICVCMYVCVFTVDFVFNYSSPETVKLEKKTVGKDDKSANSNR